MKNIVVESWAGTDLNISGYEQFRISFFEPEPRLGSVESITEPIKPIKIFDLYSSLVCLLLFSSPIETGKKRILLRFEPG